MCHLSGELNHRIEESESTGDPAIYRLPVELRLQYICDLPYVDLLSLRRSSRAFRDLIAANEAYIVRYHMDHAVPAHVARIYRAQAAADPSLRLLAGLARRMKICQRLAASMANHMTVFYYGWPELKSDRAMYVPREEAMQRRMIPPLLTLFHHFENFRDLCVKRLTDDRYELGMSDAVLGSSEGVIWGLWEWETLGGYDDHSLQQAQMVFVLLLESFKFKLRPPSYAGWFERTLRGWNRPPPPEDGMVKIIALGGIAAIERLFGIKTYEHRLRAVDQWLKAHSPSSSPSSTTASATTGDVRARLTRASDETELEPPTPLDEQDLNDQKVTGALSPALPALPASSVSSSSDPLRLMPELSQAQLDIVLPILPAELRLVWHPAASSEFLARGMVPTLDHVPVARDFLDDLLCLEESGTRAKPSIWQNIPIIEWP